MGFLKPHLDVMAQQFSYATKRAIRCPLIEDPFQIERPPRQGQEIESFQVADQQVNLLCRTMLCKQPNVLLGKWVEHQDL